MTEAQNPSAAAQAPPDQLYLSSDVRAGAPQSEVSEAINVAPLGLSPEAVVTITP